MTTLTLAVEDYFRDYSSDLSSRPSRPASAGSPSGSPPNGMATKMAPRLSHVSDLATAFSKSSPDLVQTEPAIQNARDRAAIPDSWMRLPKPEISLSPSVYVDVQQVNDAIPSATAIPSAAEKPLAPTISVKPADSPESDSVRPSRIPLRKLKSSLKLPAITKSLSEASFSPKSVRFASRLEKVKMFDGRASPSTVSLQNTPMGSPSYESPLEDYFSIRKNLDELIFDARDDDSSSDSDTFTEFTKDKEYKITTSNFFAPKNIYDKRNSPVYLQSASLSADKKHFVLLIMCQNLAFEKELQVKFTLNNWQSSLVFNDFTYMKSFSSVNFDQFKVSIPLTHFPSTINPQFCIKYVVNNTTYWDNNNSNNFQFSLSSHIISQKSKSVTVPRDSFTYKPPSFSAKSSINSADSPLRYTLVSAPPPPQHNEIVSKLKASEQQRPVVTRSASLPTLKPRYSQSFMSKTAIDKAPVSDTAKAEITEPVSVEATPARATEPETKDVAESPRDLKSMSYADILQNYCFNGVDRSAMKFTVGSNNSSCNSSTSSIHSDFMSPASTFHSLGDNLYI